MDDKQKKIVIAYLILMMIVVIILFVYFFMFKGKKNLNNNGEITTTTTTITTKSYGSKLCESKITGEDNIEYTFKVFEENKDLIVNFLNKDNKEVLNQRLSSYLENYPDSKETLCDKLKPEILNIPTNKNQYLYLVAKFNNSSTDSYAYNVITYSNNEYTLLTDLGALTSTSYSELNSNESLPTFKIVPNGINFYDNGCLNDPKLNIVPEGNKVSIVRMTLTDGDYIFSKIEAKELKSAGSKC